MGSGEKIGGGDEHELYDAWNNIGSSYSQGDAKTREVAYPQIITGEAFDLAVSSLANESDPLLQLDNMYTMSQMLKQTHLSDEKAKELYSKLEIASLKDDNTPLVALSLVYLKDNIALDYLHDDSVKAKVSKYFIGDLSHQEQLHEDYPALPGYSIITRMAPNIACSLDDYHNIESTALMGAATTIQDSENPSEDPFTNILYRNENAPLWTLTFAHDVRFRGLIEEKIGMNLADISLDAQVQLLKFMTEADDGRFDRLCSTLHGADEKVRLKLAEGFLAADFGEDFGDALLDIAESDKISGEQLEEILDKMSACRESIHNITELYHDFDGGEFAQEYARAANERLTDALTVFREIALGGDANSDLGWFGEVGFDYDSAMEALEYEAKSLEIISGTLGDVKAKKEGAFAEVILTRDEKMSRLDRTMYNFYSPEHGYVLLYTRGEGSGSFDSMVEYGKIRSKYDKTNNNSGVEASISLIVNPVDPFSLPSPFRPDHKKVKDLGYYDASTMDKVSAIRLDREGRAPGASADDPNRDPINEAGTISVDLAAINDRADTPSGKIARLFSVGNKLRSEKANRDTSLNHNTHWFDQDKYGAASGFKGIVKYVDSLAISWCSATPPSKNEGFTGLMRRQQNRGRGRKAASAHIAA